MFKKLFLLVFVSIIYVESAFANLDVKARTAIFKIIIQAKFFMKKKPDISIYPASMTKIMTSIIAFDLIKSGDLKLDEKFIISERAWRYQHQVIHLCLLWLEMKYQ
jgi:D-alanyl-D-alanine carboxypeptidase (penicillin-binding protein 5/6)